MENSRNSKILSPRQAEIRRQTGNSIEQVVGSGFYNSFTNSWKKASEKVTKSVNSVLNLMFPPSSISLINRDPPGLMGKIPQLNEFVNKNLPAPKPLHADSGTSAPTPGRFESDNEKANFFDQEMKKRKTLEDDKGNLPFKPQKINKMGTPIWKKYQIKQPERITFQNLNEKKIESKVLEIKIEKNEGKNEKNKKIENKPSNNLEKTKELTENLKRYSISEPGSVENKKESSEHEFFSQHIKSLYQTKQNSEPKKFSDSEASPSLIKNSNLPSSEPVSNEKAIKTDKPKPGPNSTPITLVTKTFNNPISKQENIHKIPKILSPKAEKNLENPFSSENNDDEKLKKKKIEQTPDFAKNSEKNITSEVSKKKISFFSSESEEKQQKDQKIFSENSKNSFFVAESEKKTEEMEEGFFSEKDDKDFEQKIEEVSKNPEKKVENTDIIIDSNILPSVSTINQNKNPFESPKKFPENKLIPTVFSNNPPNLSSNPFLATENVNQSKPIYVFGSKPSTSAISSQNMENNTNISPFSNTVTGFNPQANNSNLKNPFASNPSNIVYSPSVSSNPVSNPFSTQPNPFTSSQTYQPNPFAVNNSFQIKNTENSYSQFQPSKNFPQTSPYAPVNSFENPLITSENLYNPVQNPPNNPFSNPVSLNPFNSNPIPQVSNPFTSNQNSFSSNPVLSNPHVQNPFVTDSGINPRPQTYGMGREVDMNVDSAQTSFNNPQSAFNPSQNSFNSAQTGVFNIGNITQNRNLIKPRRYQ